MSHVEPISVVPPPWYLRGDGYVFFYRFDRAFVERCLNEEMLPLWRGGAGAVAWMDYRFSAVGPYRELLFTPGRFDLAGKRNFSITHLYVESAASVVSGRANWGLPKLRCDFDAHMDDDGTEHLIALRDDHPIAWFIVRQKLVKLPVNTALCPVTFVQRLNGKLYRTPLRISAAVSLLDILDIQVDGAYFPDVSGLMPIGAIKLSDFKIKFPMPKIKPDPIGESATKTST